MLEKPPANCVHTIVTRESVMISSTQVLSAEKCLGMNVGTTLQHVKILDSITKIHFLDQKRMRFLETLRSDAATTAATSKIQRFEYTTRILPDMLPLSSVFANV